MNGLKTSASTFISRSQVILQQVGDYLADCIDDWTIILQRPQVQAVLYMISLHPFYLSFFSVLIVYLLGYFGFSIFWCFVACLTTNYLAYILIKKTVRRALSIEHEISVAREERYPDKESALWINNIIAAVFLNHHKYISCLFLRFVNPLLEELFRIPPVTGVRFQSIDIGTLPPRISNLSVIPSEFLPDNTPSRLKFDFDVDYLSDLNGILKIRIHTFPEFTISVTDLTFKCRMRFEASFLQEKFPFISSLRISILEKPQLDISIRPSIFPDLFTIPWIMTHYVDMVQDHLYLEFGAPKFVEANFETLIRNEGDAGEKLVEDVQSILGEAIRHVTVTPRNGVPPTESFDGFFGTLGKALKRLKKPKNVGSPSTNSSAVPAAAPTATTQPEIPIESSWKIARADSSTSRSRNRSFSSGSNPNITQSISISSIEVSDAKNKLGARVGRRLPATNHHVLTVPATLSSVSEMPLGSPRAGDEVNLVQSSDQVPLPGRRYRFLPGKGRSKSPTSRQNVAVSEDAVGLTMNNNNNNNNNNYNNSNNNNNNNAGLASGGAQETSTDGPSIHWMNSRPSQQLAAGYGRKHPVFDQRNLTETGVVLLHRSRYSDTSEGSEKYEKSI